MSNRLRIDQPSKLRSLDEIQAAHDRLVAIILGDVPEVFPGEMQLVRAAADALCWALSHEHNVNFQGVLDQIDEFLEARGLRLTRVQ